MPDPVNTDRLRPIDVSEVLDRIGGDTSFLKELLTIYFREYDEKKRLLEEAVAQQDLKQVSELGHSLKGASANLGLSRLQRVALSLEIAGKERKLQPAKEALLSLEAEVRVLKAFLDENPLT
jgi:HPt (histidine-containing phosphotransfer) domain-containing protein